MQSQKLAFRNNACLVFFMLAVVGVLASTSRAQTTTNQSANINPAGARNDAPAGPDAKAPRVADVNPNRYVIGPEDMLSINVWKEPEVSQKLPVRPDGMISLPLIGEVKAAGLTPAQLEEAISTPLKKYMSEPQVTVIVTEVHSKTFNIIGQVEKPGYYPLDRQLTVLDAIALAGGFKDFAKTKKIYVLRSDASGKQERLAFNYKDVIKGQNMQENIELKPRDTIVVP